MIGKSVWRRAGVIFGLYTAGILLGFAIERRRADGTSSLGEELRKSRLQAFHHFPLRQVGRAILADDVPRAAATMTAVNLNGAALHMLAGALYLSPLLATVQGFIVGSMLAVVANARANLFTAAVLPFEVGAFALSGSLGMRIADRLCRERSGLRRALVASWPELRLGLSLVVLLQGVGGWAEALGAIRFGLPGVLSREEIAGAVGVAPPAWDYQRHPGGLR